MYPNRRAQSVQFGASLLVASLVAGLSLTRATLVDGENPATELTHHQVAQDDLVDLRNTLLRSAVTFPVRFRRTVFNWAPFTRNR